MMIRNKSTKYVLLVLMFIQFGCAEGTDKQVQIDTTKVTSMDFNRSDRLVEIPLAVNEETKIYDNEILGNKSFIFLEQSAHSDIGNIDKVVIGGQRVAVLDANTSKCIFVFDLQGKFLYSLGKANGMEPRTMYIVADKLYVLDVNNILFTHNLTDGKILSQLPLPFYTYNFSPDAEHSNRFNFYTSTAKLGATYSYWLLNIDVVEKQLVGRAMKVKKFDFKPRTILNMANSGKESYFVQTLNDTIYKINKGKIMPYIHLNFGEKTLPANLLDTLRHHQVRGFAELIKYNYASGVKNILVTPSWFHFSYGLKDVRYLVFMNRKSNKVLEFRSVMDTRYMGAIKFNPIGTYGDKFIYLINTRKLKSRIATIKAKKSKIAITPQIDSLLSRLGNNNNQVLVLASPINE